MTEQNVVVVEQIGVARLITFNRPGALNAMGGGLPARVLEELRSADADDEARVIVLTGAGRGFCAGGDVKAMYRSRVLGEGAPAASPAAGQIARGEQQGAIPRLIRKIGTPVIAAVNGDAAGAGCDIALACDLRIASERARFGEVFTRMGLVPDNGGLYLLPRIVGATRAAEMILTAEMMPAADIADWGLLNRVVPHDELLPTALDFAERIGANSPLALAMAKRGLQRAEQGDFETSFDWVNYSMDILRSSDEHKQAVQDFVEARAARNSSPQEG